MKPRITSSPNPAPTPGQRANALELSAILSRYVSRGSVIDGANLLADKFASSKGYERAAELIFRADLISSDVPLKSWGDLIKLADAVAVWLKTGEMSADPSVLAQVFPPAAEPSVEDEILRAAGFLPQRPADEGPELPLPVAPCPKAPPRGPTSGGQARPRTDAPSPKYPAPPFRGAQG